MRITKTFVDKVSLPEPGQDGKSTQAFYRDFAISGFGLRVTSGGAKSFIVEKRVDGRVKRKTLGRYGNLTVEQARKEAMKQAMFARADTNGDGVISPDEFESRGTPMFDRIDADGDGVITAEEIEAMKGKRGKFGKRGHQGPKPDTADE